MTEPIYDKKMQNRLDKSTKPQDDFFSYVNKKWLLDNPIPDSESYWGTFYTLRDQAYNSMRQIYEELQSNTYKNGTVEQQARDIYHTGIHMDDYEAEHLKIFNKYLTKIESIKDSSELPKLIGELHKIGVNDPWYAIVDADDKDSSVHIMRLRQSGLTLPDRDYYLEDSKKMNFIRKKYEEHAREVYSYFPQLAKNANVFWHDLWNLEYEIAKNSRSCIELRDVEKNYNKTTFKEALINYPNLRLDEYAKACNWKADDQLTIDQPEYFKFLNNKMTNENLDIFKTYLKWQFVATYYGRISSSFANLRFSFFGKVLSGNKKIMPLWKRVVLNIDEAIGEAVGRVYTEKYFPESSKKAVLEMVEEIRTTYADRIKSLEWMSDKTKKYALKKLANIHVLIGYPDQWRDYSKLKISRDSYLANILAAEEFENDYMMQQLQKPTSRDEWFMNPQTVNAYHDPNRLVICFPAAILQPPFFDVNAPYAVNMGGIGTVIAHEFTHGFDDQGCLFDAEGNVNNWQTEDERQSFKKRAQIIINQANDYEVLPGLNLKGELVIGESIADLGGIEIAFHALKNRLGDKVKLKDSENSLSAAEMFFIAYAVTECGHAREEKIKEQTLSDPHPISEFRVNGIVQHNDDWHQIFNVQKNDLLYRAPNKRARIW